MRRRTTIVDHDTNDEPLINLTPLIDVVFVVLITFMIVAPVLEIDRVELAPGIDHRENTQSSESHFQPITITVHADNSIWVERRSVSLTELEKWLGSQKKRYPLVTPKLIHDSRAQFGTYQNVKNRIEACGFREMEVVLQPQ